MKPVKKKNFVKDKTHIKKYYFLGFNYLTKEKNFNYRKIYLFNFCIGYHQLRGKKSENTLPLEKLFTEKKEINKQPIDIIIPVYNGYDYLIPLFESILRHTDLEYHLIVIDDYSPDKRVFQVLERYKDIFLKRMTLIRNDKNIGFLKTVNKAFQKTTHHVVILNTDVVVPEKWASKLMKPIFIYDNVASVTPFSNAATIFSLPIIFQDNTFEDDLENVNKKISQLNIPYEKLMFSTGVGFCMAMNKKVLNKIGYFDEVFGKGYGEENDWCQRAINAGYINTIAGDLFVWHKHGASFDNVEKQKLIKENIKKIDERYPEYQKESKDIVCNDNYMSLRFITELLYFNSVAEKTQVFIDHSWGGGTETYIFNQFNLLKEKTLCVRMQEDGTGFIQLSYFYKEYENVFIFKNTEDIKILLSHLTIDMLVLNNLASYKAPLKTLQDIAWLKKKTGAIVSFRGHDFQSICPSITLMTHLNQYCNCSNFKGCVDCFKKDGDKMPIKTPCIEKWQSDWGYFFNAVVDEAIVFSQSTFDIFSKLYPQLKDKMEIVPHFIKPIRMVNIKPHKDINIAVLGAIGIQKGSLIIKEMDGLLSHYPRVNIKVVGVIHPSKLKKVKILGKYNPVDLPKIMEKNKIDIVLIPSVWPETFSYTTSEAMSMGLPVACFDLGAPAERVAQYEKGLILPKMDARSILDEITQFLKEK